MRSVYGHTLPGKIVLMLSLAAILLGCAAFEAGNILGAVAGISLVWPHIPGGLVVLAIGSTAAILLWMGTIRQIALLLGFIVAFLGICFVITAFLIPINLWDLLENGLIPSIPAGSEILVLGLIGTTVVPYNLFLGSGLRHTQTPREMKMSLFIAIGLGGFISIAVLITGTAISGVFSFEALAAELTRLLGPPGRWLLGLGLFGAGLSSSLTAALAAAVTTKSISKYGDSDEGWSHTGRKFRLIWGAVLLTGILFGYLRIQPIPAIILAQALNGILLPLIAMVLFLLINNSILIPESNQNGRFYNLATSIVVYITFLIGITNLFRVYASLTDTIPVNQLWIAGISFVVFIIAGGPVIRKIRKS